MQNIIKIFVQFEFYESHWLVSLYDIFLHSIINLVAFFVIPLSNFFLQKGSLHVAVANVLNCNIAVS